ncbi:MAG: cytochrome c oxidase assembly protein [Betaproteobacteria bacterium]|jgi:cytochrome c oxidase assembly protein subunit 11|nr:cytochrome c oxidase assembly protein [Betaproteobacteria bacterium]
MSQALQTAGQNKAMFGKLLMIAILMFSFGYALVPLYNAICEATGINVLTSREKLDYAEARRFAKNTQVDVTRNLSIEFDANSHGPWTFKPKNNVLEGHPGEIMTILYEITNNLDREVQGQAIPSYAPKQSATYFKKLECFCFEQQTLKPRETKEFPVVFVIDPKLPDGIRNITLSYTFFEVGTNTALGGAPSVGQPAKGAQR